MRAIEEKQWVNIAPRLGESNGKRKEQQEDEDEGHGTERDTKPSKRIYIRTCVDMHLHANMLCR